MQRDYRTSMNKKKTDKKKQKNEILKEKQKENTR